MAKTTTENLTPMMQQWHACKEKAKDALLLFRLGDFYEAFFDDAERLSSAVGVALTKRQGTPMSGVPVHTFDAYAEKLVQLGLRVAVAEQLENPKDVKGIVKRDIVRILSPATHHSSLSLTNPQSQYFASVAILNQTFGLALLDLSTGEFFTLEVETLDQVFDEMIKRSPKELLISKKFEKKYIDWLDRLKNAHPLRLSVEPDWQFDHPLALETLCRHFQVHTLDGFGLQGRISCIVAAGALMNYISDRLCQDLKHIEKITAQKNSQYLAIDSSTLKHLEILSTSRGQFKGSLLEQIDKTLTPMGQRCFRFWITHPLVDCAAIQERQDAVAHLLNEPHDHEKITNALLPIRDIERLMMRICGGYAGPRELHALALSLETIPSLAESIQSIDLPFFQARRERLFDTKPIRELIQRALVDEPPLKLTEGNIFRRGYLKELDALYDIQTHGDQWLEEYQAKLREELSIKTLRVNYTKAFGYYIEVSKGQADRMPADFVRRQTLVNAERFLSDELKAFETRILGAQEEIRSMEYKAFVALREEISKNASAVMALAHLIAEIDMITSFATCAKQQGYVKPRVDTSDCLHIDSGRHPVIEKLCQQTPFVPNDTHLERGVCQLQVITGPNMAGKSTYIRQVALITLLAQMGSFVPAKSAHIGIVDRIFSRIGASDDISRGQSTFMVEMSETANILNHATDRSLVILDEIGRGTSTFDGIAIAKAVAEHLILTPGCRPKTLFATHYWELCALEEKHKEVSNFQVSVQEIDSGIVFLHKIIAGGADKSYGIHVAKLAGLPLTVIKRAEEHLENLHVTPSQQALKKKSSMQKNQAQMGLFDSTPKKIEPHPAVEQLQRLCPEAMTPLEALQWIIDWKAKI